MAPSPPEQCRNCPMFLDPENFCANLKPDELAELSHHSCLASFQRDQAIDADTFEEFPILAITSGVLGLQHLLFDGRKTIAALFMRGDILDLRKSGNKRLGVLVGLSKVTLCRLPPQVFEKCLANNPDARNQVWQNLTDQAFRAIDHAADLANKQALEKLASFILECRSRNPRKSRKGQVHIPIRRRDLAEYLGMQPETVSRSFKDLEKRGFIKVLELSSLRIRNVPALEQIANGNRAPADPDKSEGAQFNILVTKT